MRYFLCLSYDGSEFCGWQIQPSAPSVQACLEGALSRLLGRPVPVTGAGRTDTGVHAVNYVAHFDTDGPLPYQASDFIYKLNAILPRTVAILSLSEVPADTHARFSARRREYTYFIHRQKDPFVRQYSWLCGYPELDFDAMNAACRHLLGTHDFSCFEKSGGDNKTSLCTVFEARWEPYVPSHIQVMKAGAESVAKGGEEIFAKAGEETFAKAGAETVAKAGAESVAVPLGKPLRSSCATSSPTLPDEGYVSFGRACETAGGGVVAGGTAVCEAMTGGAAPFGVAAGEAMTGGAAVGGVAPSCTYWYFRIAADRFLRNMVRATVGSLIEVGRGKHDPEWIAQLIASGTRSDAGESVPGHALFLNKVSY